MKITVRNLLSAQLSCDLGNFTPGETKIMYASPEEAYKMAEALKTLQDAGRITVAVEQEDSLLDAAEGGGVLPGADGTMDDLTLTGDLTGVDVILSGDLTINGATSNVIVAPATPTSSPYDATYVNTVAVLDKLTDTASNHASVYSVMEANPSANTAKSYRGGYFIADSTSGNARNFTGAILGLEGRAAHNGTGTVTRIDGVDGTVLIQSSGGVTEAFGASLNVTNSSTATVGAAYGLRARVVNSNAGGTISNAYTLYARDSTDLGTVTAKAGVVIEEMTTAGRNTDLLIGTATVPVGNYAIYSASTRDSAWGNGAGILYGNGNIYAPTVVSGEHRSAGAAPINIWGVWPDGGASVGVTLGSEAVYYTAGAKLAKFMSGAVERSYVDLYGVYYGGLSSTGGLVTTRLAKPVIATVVDVPGGGTLNASTEYTYRVAAMGVAGALTDMSVIASTTTSADALNTHAITITWGAVQGCRQFRVYGRTSGVGDKLLTTLGGNVLTWTDDNSLPEGAVGPATNDSGGLVIAGSVVADDVVCALGSYGLAQDGASLYWYGANAQGVISTNADDSGGPRVGLTLKNGVAMTNAASKLISIKNANVEKVSVDKDGTVTANAALLQYAQMLTLWGATELDVKGIPTNTATAQAIRLSSHTNLTAAGSKILSIHNDAAGGNAEVAAVAYNGVLQFPAGDSVLTPGGATINKVTGRSALASGAAAVTITNSLVTGDSNIFIQRGLDDATAVQISVVMAQALVNGATRACKSLTFTAATGAYIVGETITETGSGATGVVEAVEQAAGVGTLVLSTAGAFTGSATLTGSAAAVTSTGGATVSTALAVDFDNQDTNFTIGRQVVGRSSGAKGTIVAQNDPGGNGTLGLTGVTGAFSDNEELNDGGKFKVTANAVATNHIPFMWWVVNQ